jgi:hypothetical protein
LIVKNNLGGQEFLENLEGINCYLYNINSLLDCPSK